MSSKIECEPIVPALLKREIKSGVPKGIRTPVTAVKGQCPRPLDDGDLTGIKLGGARRDRTADLLHAMQALSQLSYSPGKQRSDTAPAAEGLHCMHPTR